MPKTESYSAAPLPPLDVAPISERRRTAARMSPKPQAKTTRDLKAGLIDAATAYGSDGKGKGGLPGYLFLLAAKHPKAFANLLGKMLPLQVNSDVRNSVVGQVSIVSIPIGQFISQADAARLAGGDDARTIEHDAAEVNETADE